MVSFHRVSVFSYLIIKRIYSTFRFKREPLKFENFFLLNGWRPGLMLAFFALSYGILMNYLAIYGKEELGITGGTGAFYLVMAAGLILSRLVGGRNLRKGKLLKWNPNLIMITRVGKNFMC